MAYTINLQGRILYLPMHMVQLSDPGRGKPTALLQELAASIGEVGILQPLTVRRAGDRFLLVSGNRRLMAAKMAGLGEVPCLVLDASEADTELIALTENLQREDLSYFQEAEYLQRYLCRSGLTQAQAAKKLGRSQPAVANKLRLLQHSPKVRAALAEQGLSERHARELLRVRGETERLTVLGEIVRKGLSVAQTESYIDAYLGNQTARGDARYRRRDTRLFLDRMAEDTAILRSNGVPAELTRQDTGEEILVTVRIGQT